MSIRRYDMKIKVWRFLACLLVGSTACVDWGGGLRAAEPSISILGESLGEVEALSALGETRLLDAKGQVLSLHPGDGPPVELLVLSLFEPESGLFWWNFVLAPSNRRADAIAELSTGRSLVVTADEILAIQMASPPPSLWLFRSSAKWSSRAEGERALRGELVSHFEDLKKGDHPWVSSIELTRRLDESFYFLPGHAMPRLELELVSARSTDSGWVLELEGREGRRARLALDPDLRPLEIEEIDPADR